jgi:hypothetical protein
MLGQNILPIAALHELQGMRSSAYRSRALISCVRTGPRTRITRPTIAALSQKALQTVALDKFASRTAAGTISNHQEACVLTVLVSSTIESGPISQLLHDLNRYNAHSSPSQDQSGLAKLWTVHGETVTHALSLVLDVASNALEPMPFVSGAFKLAIGAVKALQVRCFLFVDPTK